MDKATSMVALSVLYDTGARDEDPALTGIAHLMEHLMFAGSVNVPEFDAALQRSGGQNNAWTSSDFTCFYDIVPAHNAETAFWLESDRMLELAFSQESFDVQQKVVVQEFYQQILNQPYGDLQHTVRSLVYPGHPYAWPVCGLEPDHIRKATLADIKDYYFSHYSPSNAVVAVAGNIDFATVERYARKWFGSIPARPVAPRRLPAVVAPAAPILKEMTGNVPSTLISISYLMEPYGRDGYFVSDLVSDVLASGRSSLFYRELVNRSGLFDDVDASITASEHEGTFNISAVLRQGADENMARKAIDNILETFVSKPVKKSDIQRALNRMESRSALDNLDIMNFSQNLSKHHYHGELPETIQDNYRDITPEMLRSHAEKLLDPEKSVTVIYRPGNS